MSAYDPISHKQETLTVLLSEAGPDDLSSILGWMRDLYAQEQVGFDEPAAEGALRELIRHPELGRLYVLCADGHAVGYAVVGLSFSLEKGGRVAFLDELYVRPSSRGRGTGSIALRLLQSACRGMGAQSFAAEVHLENARAEALFRREGLVSNGRHVMSRRL
jgi:L-amino acid N-acyltransferase YncA